MSTNSEKDPDEKSGKHRLWELEEQLNEEQYEHRKTKFALREAQEKLEQMSNEMKNQKMKDDDMNLKEENEQLSKTIEDLRQEVARLTKSKNETVKSLEMSKLENEDLRNRQLESSASFKSTIYDLGKKIDILERRAIVEKEKEPVNSEKKDLEDELKKKNRDIEVLHENVNGLNQQMKFFIRSNVRFSRVTESLKDERLQLAKLLMTAMEKIQESVSRSRPVQLAEEGQFTEAVRQATSKSQWFYNFSLFELSAGKCFYRFHKLQAEPNSETALYELRRVYERDRPRFDEASAYLKNNSPSSHWIQQGICEERDYFKKVEEILEEFARKDSRK